MVSLLDISKAIEQIPDVKEAHSHELMKFQAGVFQRTKKNRIKLTISFDADQCIKENVNGIPLTVGDWKLFPVLVFLDIDFSKKKK